MKILLIGNTGQLGWELERQLAPLGFIRPIDYPAIDLANPDSIRSIVAGDKYDVIVNPAAYTQVDRAEEEPEKTRAINAQAPGIIAELAAKQRAAFIHYSTDYVFDGTKGSPYTEEDVPNPLGVYGKTKFSGEKTALDGNPATIVLRTSCVYSLRRDCFVTKVLQWSREKEILRFADDLVGSPTSARMLAEQTVALLRDASENLVGWVAENRGVYHLAGAGAASRYEWAKAILELDPRRSEQRVREVLPAKAADFPAAAPRPLYSALDCGRAVSVFGRSLRSWQDNLGAEMTPATEIIF